MNHKNINLLNAKGIFIYMIFHANDIVLYVSCDYDFK